MNDNLGICNPIWVPNGFLDQDFAAICDDLINLGIKWIRTDFLWNVIQPKQTTWDWSNYDRFVTIANSKDLKILAVLGYSNGWANGGQSVYMPPTNVNDFANFVSAVSSRYEAQGVDTFEVWNEPNNAGNWLPSVNPTAYANLLRTSYSAIKAVNPNSSVLIGGLATMSDDGMNLSPETFLRAVYNAIGKQYFDIVSYHAYGWSAAQIAAIKAVMMANGDSVKPIWFTEYGAPTNGVQGQDFVDEDEQARLIADKINIFRDVAEKLFFYNYQDSSAAQPDREGYFGIKRADGTPKAVYQKILSEWYNTSSS